MFNKDKSAANFCHHVVVRVWDRFCNFYLVKNHKIVDSSITTEAREKYEYNLGILRVLEFFM
jgi:hypothetical protein